MKIILISGKAQHGKDTFAKMLKEQFEQKNNQVKIIHFGDVLKFICEKYYNWNGKKDVVGRTLLQYVGTEIVREKDEHFWTDFVGRLARTFECDYVIIPDWRFIEEHTQMLEYFDDKDIITLRIERYENFSEGIKYINPIMTEEQLLHRSEIELDNYYVDYIIVNETLENLTETADFIVHEMEEN